MKDIDEWVNEKSLHWIFTPDSSLIFGPKFKIFDLFFESVHYICLKFYLMKALKNG